MYYFDKNQVLVIISNKIPPHRFATGLFVSCTFLQMAVFLLTLLRVPGVNFDPRGPKRVIIFQSLESNPSYPGIFRGQK